MKTIIASVAALFLVVCMVPPTQAHDYWIMPSSFHPDGSGIVESRFTSSHSYFAAEEVPDISKFRVLMVTPQQREIPLVYSSVETNAAVIPVPLTGPGCYTIAAVSTAPEYWCKTTDGWKPGRKGEFQNILKAGKYVKTVKSFINVGSPNDTRILPLGHTIEIVPQRNPAMLKAGQSLPVLVLYQDRPIPDVPVFGIYEGYKTKDHNDRPVKTRSAADGIAKVKIDRPGKWLLYAKYEIDTPDNPHADYANYRPYMLFEVQ